MRDAARELRPKHQKAETRPYTEAEARVLLATARAHSELDGVPIGPLVAVCLHAKLRSARPAACAAATWTPSARR